MNSILTTLAFRTHTTHSHNWDTILETPPPEQQRSIPHVFLALVMRVISTLRLSLWTGGQFVSNEHSLLVYLFSGKHLTEKPVFRLQLDLIDNLKWIIVEGIRWSNYLFCKNLNEPDYYCSYNSNVLKLKKLWEKSIILPFWSKKLLLNLELM